MLAMFREMLRLQAAVNAKINPNWLGAGHPYLRAVLVESAEAIDHHGWKWWAKQVPAMDQLRVELVDVWHFALSHFLVAHQGALEPAADWVAKQWCDPATAISLRGIELPLQPRTLLERLDVIAGLAGLGEFKVSLFRDACDSADLPLNDLFRSYVGKNVLNHFRQDHGYKLGQYVKHWEGREDNEHLTDLLRDDPSAPEKLWSSLYAGLESRYARMLKGSSRAD